MIVAMLILLGVFFGVLACGAAGAYREWRRARLIRSLIQPPDEISEECRELAVEPTREYNNKKERY